jgi:ubiquinone/menaquinone biosynthesis C-methylase UbiE
MRVLDVGCAQGDVSFLAARLVGSTGFVVGVDRVPAAVEAAARRGRDMSATNTRFPVADIGGSCV